MSDEVEFATPSGDAWKGLHEYLERMDREVADQGVGLASAGYAHAAGAACSGDALTLDDLNAAVAVLKANNVPAFEGYYTARVHPMWWWRARRCASRLKYKGGRKYRQAVRELRENALLEALVIWVRS
jgi:hypothetical protein